MKMHYFLRIKIFLIFVLFNCSHNEDNKLVINEGFTKLPELVCKDLSGHEEIIKTKIGQILVINYWSIG
jgi:hypothetical protein